MSSLDINYRFKILSVDQEQSTMLVEFDPLDDDCLPVTLNCLFQLENTGNFPDYENPESIPLVEHLRLSATMYAPMSTWKNQKYIALNSTALTDQVTANTYISTN